MASREDHRDINNFEMMIGTIVDPVGNYRPRPQDYYKPVTIGDIFNPECCVISFKSLDSMGQVYPKIEAREVLTGLARTIYLTKVEN